MKTEYDERNMVLTIMTITGQALRISNVSRERAARFVAKNAQEFVAREFRLDTTNTGTGHFTRGFRLETSGPADFVRA